MELFQARLARKVLGSQAALPDLRPYGRHDSDGRNGGPDRAVQPGKRTGYEHAVGTASGKPPMIRLKQELFVNYMEEIRIAARASSPSSMASASAFVVR